jgi:transcription elongation factor Elf1
MKKLESKNACPVCNSTKDVSYDRNGTSSGTAAVGIGVVEGHMTSYFYCKNCSTLFDVTTNYKRINKKLMANSTGWQGIQG